MILKITHDMKTRWNIRERISGIYIITNKINGKKYIGQSNNMRKRFSDYNSKNKKDSRPIYQDIRKFGSDNFTFEIIELDNERELMDEKETYYIKKFNTLDPDFGYNQCLGGGGCNNPEARKRLSLAHTGLKESSMVKRKKSNPIIAVNLKEHIVILSDSAKLFGDYIGSTKDYIKNCLRTPYKIKDFMLFYDDSEKRHDMLTKMYLKRSIRNIDYVEIAKFLCSIENESVETIYDLVSEKYGKILYLSYDNVSDDGSVFLVDYII